MDNYTAFISCSPRDSDKENIAVEQIINCIESIRKHLFQDVMIYIIFDGIENRPDTFTENHTWTFKIKS